ncbi:Phosphoadenosine phosphosulfate reductase [Methylobacterium tardum]|uniref:Phosphoadenosine phosphosulphate reductase domain-containing protein n=1 Tax=Methylobacterium tardum TaxID=374432 RepID=A0AA37TP16_9HYPH|nr:phosphoadenosine phosphosulfate reductase family protein [Methylobacterium tardum]URD40306.1 phosphoadenosine phosphosulfate reductase family protein [Methylobacterium tardum]GJE53208.1 Phosphoadenosine phosphosulfate reductase [Methylobacterium tardum]GLS74633.1 hypothetical protein GCM10007890_66510 [Methylobacterium tardum]
MTAPAPNPRLADLTATARATLSDIYSRHEHVFLGFSGGKDSLALLHVCEPWRDRVTLLWSNTGYMAAHMAAFVRGHGERWRLVEVSPERDMLDDWSEHGTPVDVVAIGHLEGLDWNSPRVRPWPLCCRQNRMAPLVAYLARFERPCVLLNGQRQSDKGTTPERMAEIMSSNVTTAMPLWAWSTSDVLTYLAAHAIPLPPHHGVFQGSMECAVCPADLKPGRLRVLDRFEPHAAAFVRSTARISLGFVAARTREIEAVLAETAPPPPELRPCRPMSSASPAGTDHRRHST